MLNEKNFCYLRCSYFIQDAVGVQCVLDLDGYDDIECPYRLELLLLRGKEDRTRAEMDQALAEMFKRLEEGKDEWDQKYGNMTVEEIRDAEQKEFDDKIEADREAYEKWVLEQRSCDHSDTSSVLDAQGNSCKNQPLMCMVCS